MAYISESYSLKYYKEFTNRRGELVRFEILQKGNLSSSMYPRKIGDFGQLKLRVQGGQDEIDTPVIKTSVDFSMIDSWDKPSGNVKDSTKYGNWDEFYTPDSTQYLVVIKTRPNTSASWVTRWSGYITPDNWREQLDYYGEIVITARDNIGHLQDFDFDAAGDDDGMISVQNLLIAAAQKISLPMDLEFIDSESGDVESLTAGSTSVKPSQLLVCVEAFKKKSWFEAIEETLNSIGYVLRYMDNNKLVCVSLRFLETMGTTSLSPGSIELAFLGGGTRSLSPAYSKIVESVDYGFEEEVEIRPQDIEELYNNTGQYSCWLPIVNVAGGEYSTGDAAGIAERTPNGWKQSGGNMCLNHSLYQISDAALRDEGDKFGDALFIVANISSSASARSILWQQHVAHMGCSVTFEFAEKPAAIYDNKLTILPAALLYARIQIRFKTSGGTIYYLDPTNVWSTTPYTWERHYNLEDKATEIGAYFIADGNLTNGTIQVVFLEIQYEGTSSSSYSGYKGCYARLKKVTVKSNWGSKHVDSDTVTTINNTNYNIKVERKPMFGCLSIEQSPGMPQHYVNAFFLRETNSSPVVPAPYSWTWSDESNSAPFTAQIHKQLLQYHHSTNEVLEGDSIPASDSVFITLNKLFMYKNVKHILQSCVLDFVTGRFNSAIFRSFLSWSDLWHGEASTLSVVPSSLDLRNTSGGVITLTSNTSWRVTNIPNGLNLSAESGSGNATITVAKTSAFTSSGAITIKTTDDDVTVNIFCQAAVQLSVGYNGPSDPMHMYYEDGHYFHFIDIQFNESEEPGFVPVDKPSWLHFDDSDCENGSCISPGTYSIYLDEMPSGTNSRSGYITVSSLATGEEVELQVQQIRW